MCNAQNEYIVLFRTKPTFKKLGRNEKQSPKSIRIHDGE
jgi:hypothetical protein